MIDSCKLCLKRFREHRLTRRALIVKGIVTVSFLAYAVHPDPVFALGVNTFGTMIWLWFDG